jgi:hypothetical protein
VCVVDKLNRYAIWAAPTKGDEMAKKKKIVRRAWTPSEVRELRSLAKKKVGVKRISKGLNRTVAATKMKASQLGVSLESR